ncbi:MAG: alpha/beta hydrolase [Dermatophilaceae bacterium]
MRYDLRDCGASTTIDPEGPSYTLRDLAADAAALARELDGLFSRPMPDWSDRDAVAEFAIAGAQILGDDPIAARASAERKWDRTPGTEPAVQMANQLGMVFAKLDCTPRWRERLSQLAIPVLVVHGRRDAFFPVGNGEALMRDIPGARLLVLERAATAIPDAAADEVGAAMLALGTRS